MIKKGVIDKRITPSEDGGVRPETDKKKLTEDVVIRLVKSAKINTDKDEDKTKEQKDS